MREKFKRSDYCEALGMFVIQFEYLVDTMRDLIIECFKEKGLREKKLVELTMSKLTAKPILELIQPIFHVSYPNQRNAKREIDILVNQVDRLITDRNLIVHGFHEGYGPDEAGSYTTKKTKTKTGLRVDVGILDVPLLNRYLHYMDAVRRTFVGISQKLGNEREVIKIIQMFRVDDPPIIPNNGL
jgi:hypothetical protein